MTHVFLGIDPGLGNTGWGVIAAGGGKLRYIAAGVITTSASQEMASRLLHIHEQLQKVIVQYTPHYAAIEVTYVNKNYGSSLKLAHARAAAILTASLQGLMPVEYQAKIIKKALTGSGSADKEQIIAMLGLLMPGVCVNDNNAADALAIAICHAHHLRV